MNEMKELYDSGKGTPEFNLLVERVKSGSDVGSLDLRIHYLISKSKFKLIRNNPKIVIDLACIFVIIFLMMTTVLIFLTPNGFDYAWTDNLKDSVSKPIIAYVDVMSDYVYAQMVWLSLYTLLFVAISMILVLAMFAMLWVLLSIIFISEVFTKTLKLVFSKFPTPDMRNKLPKMKKYTKEDFE